MSDTLNPLDALRAVSFVSLAAAVLAVAGGLLWRRGRRRASALCLAGALLALGAVVRRLDAPSPTTPRAAHGSPISNNPVSLAALAEAIRCEPRDTSSPAWEACWRTNPVAYDDAMRHGTWSYA